jgi:hypothetical protein
MANVTVKASKNGPYEGAAKLVEDSGQEYAESAIYPLYLLPLRRVEKQTFLRRQP